MPASRKSLRLRLSVFFAVFLAIAWGIAAITAWVTCKESINEFFDTQQMLFAKRLAETDFTHNTVMLSDLEKRQPGVSKKALGDLEDDALGVAVFTITGDIVMADAGNGRHFPFKPNKKGFSEETLLGEDNDIWRIVRLDAKDGKHIVMVGQEVDYRQEMALEMLGNQLIPWIVFIPVLLLGLIFLLGRELIPLRDMARQLLARTPEDATPLDVAHIPSEVLPMAEALNAFFSKTNAMLTRERSFISDAAHELRTPLAGLRVQTQVIAQKGISEKNRGEAATFLLQGIDRCSRLVEQLLALSRLDAMNGVSSSGAPFTEISRTVVDWAALFAELAQEYRAKTERKALRLDYEITAPCPPTQGDPALIAILLRNLLDNAVAYTPQNGRIRIHLENNRLRMENTMSGSWKIDISRLSERFFRPPGQEEPGSGLGLSIVQRIAEIHHFRLIIHTQDGKPDDAEPVFCVTLNFANSMH